MSRAPGVAPRLVLPVPPEKYDAADQRELRRLVQDAHAQPASFDAVTSVPKPVAQLGALAGAADTVPYFDASGALTDTAITAFIRSLLAEASASAARTLLGAVLARSTVAFTTAALAGLAFENGSVTPPATVTLLLTIEANAPCWVRLYTSDAARTADSARALGTDPAPGIGVLAEFDFSLIGAATIPCSPVPVLSNDDTPRAATIYYAVQNTDSALATITITLEVLPAEL